MIPLWHLFRTGKQMPVRLGGSTDRHSLLCQQECAGIFLPQRQSTSSPWHTHLPLAQGTIVPCVSKTWPRPMPGQCFDSTALVSKHWLFPFLLISSFVGVHEMKFSLLFETEHFVGGYWWHMHFQFLFNEVFLSSERLYNTLEFGSKQR